MQDKLQIYFQLLRLNKPVGFLLLLFPCLFGLSLGKINSPDYNFKQFLIYSLTFIILSIIMRGVGCIINDMADKNFDKYVERTKNRPLAAGKISMLEAGIFALILSIISLIIAFFVFPHKSVVIAVLSMVLVIIYPFMKRFTYFPQLILGFTFNIGALVGFQVYHEINISAAILYFSCILWTLGYDTIYAMSDVKDDLQIGIKSTAIYFGEKTPGFVAIFYSWQIILLSILGIINKFKKEYFIIILFTLGFLLIQIWQIRKKNIDYQRIFCSNAITGLLLLIALNLGN